MSHDIFYWMTNRKLKLTADNTKFCIIATQKQRGKPDCFFPDIYAEPDFHAGDLSTEFRRLPLLRILDSLFPKCVVAFIRDLRCIRRYISLSVAKTIATALASSRLDYCNSLYHNIALRTSRNFNM